MKPKGNIIDTFQFVAPIPWWPPASELHLYPLNPDRSFFSSVTDSCAPFGFNGCVQLSRLGKTIFSGGVWSFAEDESKEKAERKAVDFSQDIFICVYNPFSGHEINLLLDMTHLLDIASIKDLCLTSIIDCICIRPAKLVPSLYKTKLSSVGILLRRAIAPSLAQLQQFIRAEGLGFTRPLLSVMISGESENDVHTCLRYLQGEVLCTTQGTYADPKCPSFFYCESRTLNLLDILALDEREAIETVSCGFRVPILQTHETSTLPGMIISKEGHSKSAHFVLFITIEHLELLCGLPNSICSLIAYQLCSCIDMLNTQQTSHMLKVVVWSSMVHVNLNSLPASLATKLSLTRVHVPTRVTAEDCVELVSEVLGNEEAKTIARAAQFLSLKSVSELNSKDFSVIKKELTAELSQGTFYTHSVGLTSNLEGKLFGMDSALDMVEEFLIWPITHLKELQKFHIPCPKGALIYGPTGSGKTALLRLISSKLGHDPNSFDNATSPIGKPVRCLIVDGLTLIEKEVGKSEKNIARLFANARSLAPCVLFLDNLDALAPPRDRQSVESTTTTDRTLSTLLTEMDGIGGDSSRAVIVIASASALSSLDGAVYRPGRLDIHIQLEYPSIEESIQALSVRFRRFIATLLDTLGGARNSDASSDERELYDLGENLVKVWVRNCYGAKIVASPAESVAAVREGMLKVLYAIEACTKDQNPKGVEFPQGSAKFLQQILEGMCILSA